MNNSKCFKQINETSIEIDTRLINYKKLRKAQDSRTLFFNSLSKYGTSTEMMTTWLGREPGNGGMVLIPWNVLATLVNCLMTDSMSPSIWERTCNKLKFWQKSLL